MSQNLEDLYLQSYPFTTAAAIIGSVDRKVFVSLWDGRTLFGVLRTFDQFGNLVIHDGIERLYFLDKKQYAETETPQIFLIRGENVVMMGELDIDKEDLAIEGWEKIDHDSAETIAKKESQNIIDKANVESELLVQHGIMPAGPTLY